MSNAYLARLQYAASKDPKVIKKFLRVAGMVAGPETLFHPALVARVLRLSPRTPAPGPSWLAAEDPASGTVTDLPKAA